MRVTAIHSVTFREVFDAHGGRAITAWVRTIAGQRAEAVASCAEMNDKQFAEAMTFANEKTLKALRGLDAVEQADVDRKINLLCEQFDDQDSWAPFARALSMAVARVGASASGRELYEHLREFAPFSGPGWAMPVPIILVHTDDTGAFRSVRMAINPRASRGPRRSIRTLLNLARKTLAAFTASANAPLQNSDEVITVDGLNNTLTQLLQSTHAAGLRRNDVRIGIDFGRTLQQEQEADTSDDEAGMLHLCHMLIRRYPIGMVENSFRDEQTLVRAQGTYGDQVLFLRNDVANRDAGALTEAVTNHAVGAAAIDLWHFRTIGDALAYAVKARGMNVPRILRTSAKETLDDFLIDFAFATGAEYVELGGFGSGGHVAKYNRLLELANRHEL
ncbi:hypothetical protein COV04_03440 [Candidatus Uhrbacteria bacterium CG10_big_fil_rev_8_21_14_0_10_48_11]|uniref:Enolase n=1 Tax=Candidatus Uhrbacteria bacterium CG10_big_fil_rev_8_21_14_0_10_48_11 TaxID=1975037 RepID=A0A2M8LE27_9BACT|nr:MAG: hypothetical protein COV04_03440 [Candidatus Uhrbacteria bacterium CG10_big_fil_rev_8_21_14_0_10_48_11]